MIRGMLALGALSLTLTGCYNFHTVAEGKVYRSAQPLEEEMSARVRKHHIKTVLRLRNSSEFWRECAALPHPSLVLSTNDLYNYVSPNSLTKWLLRDSPAGLS